MVPKYITWNPRNQLFVGVYEGMHVAYVTLTHRLLLAAARAFDADRCVPRAAEGTDKRRGAATDAREGGEGGLQATMSRGWIPTPTTTYAQGDQVSCVIKP